MKVINKSYPFTKDGLDNCLKDIQEEKLRNSKIESKISIFREAVFVIEVILLGAKLIAILPIVPPVAEFAYRSEKIVDVAFKASEIIRRI